MKTTTIAFLLLAGSIYFIITGYASGPANANGFDCTGAETGLSNPAGCSYQGGCHGASATTGITLLLELDSAGVSTTHYKPGMNYTVKLVGTNTVKAALPRFGFQIGSIKGSSAQVTPVNVGSWPAPYPASTHYSTPSTSKGFVVGLVEHSAALPATTGTGGIGTTYVETFNWTAPSTGTGTVSIWAVLNAVNLNGSADAGDAWNLIKLVLNEWPATTDVASIQQNNFNLNIFPNPASEYIRMNYMTESNTLVNIELFDIAGKKICNLLNEQQNSGQHHETFNLTAFNLKSGICFLKMTAGDKITGAKFIIK